MLLVLDLAVRLHCDGGAFHFLAPSFGHLLELLDKRFDTCGNNCPALVEQQRHEVRDVEAIGQLLEQAALVDGDADLQMPLGLLHGQLFGAGCAAACSR
eukprot:scaffold134760_cov72-Phaeocystis_antarctica.AAC.2